MGNSSPLPQPGSQPIPGGLGCGGSLGAQQAESKPVLCMGCGSKQDPDRRDQSPGEAKCGRKEAGFQLPEDTEPDLGLFWARDRTVQGQALLHVGRHQAETQGVPGVLREAETQGVPGVLREAEVKHGPPLSSLPSGGALSEIWTLTEEEVRQTLSMPAVAPY